MVPAGFGDSTQGAVPCDHAVEADDGAAAAATAHGEAATRGALTHFIACRMDFWAPRAKMALTACLLLGPQQEQHPNAVPADVAAAQLLCVSVEAAGSGVVVVPELRVHRDATVAELKEMLFKRGGGGGGDDGDVPTTTTVRLFLGHGGAELSDDQQSLRAYAVPEGATLVQVPVDDCKVVAILMFGRDEEPTSRWSGVTKNASGRVVALDLEGAMIWEHNRVEGVCVSLSACSFHPCSIDRKLVAACLWWMWLGCPTGKAIDDVLIRTCIEGVPPS
jgi:hypothetical protein